MPKDTNNRFKSQIKTHSLLIHKVVANLVAVCKHFSSLLCYGTNTNFNDTVFLFLTTLYHFFLAAFLTSMVYSERSEMKLNEIESTIISIFFVFSLNLFKYHILQLKENIRS